MKGRRQGNGKGHVVPRAQRPTSPASRAIRAQASVLEQEIPRPRAKRPKRASDARLHAVEQATLTVARLFAAADWRLPDGEVYPDGGWAMVRGLVIWLAYQEWACAYGMRRTEERAVTHCWPEVAGALDEARATFRALPLAELTPEHFGHVHEVLVGHGLVDGAVVPTGGRRKYGAHFTPPELALKVTRTTLEPLLAVLRSKVTSEPLGRRVLELKVCDPAVGAGAFLLALVRELAPFVLEDGEASTLEEAKRLVAIHVAHGVDKDRYAVYASQLALTLECRADRMPASWLDHAIHHGDALVGLSGDQIKAFHWKKDATPIPEVGELYDRAIDQAARATIAHRAQLAAQARHA